MNASLRDTYVIFNSAKVNKYYYALIFAGGHKQKHFLVLIALSNISTTMGFHWHLLQTP